jgi:hypothetical protein
MQQDTLHVNGTLIITLYDKDYVIKEERRIKNLVVAQGTSLIAQRLLGTTSAVITHMQLGEGATGAHPSNVALQFPLGTRAAVSSASDTIFTTNDSAKYTATFTTDVSGHIREAGLFSSITGNTLRCRTVFPVIHKTSEDILSIVWILTFGAPA